MSSSSSKDKSFTINSDYNQDLTLLNYILIKGDKLFSMTWKVEDFSTERLIDWIKICLQ